VEFKPLKLPGTVVIEPRVWADDRGYFMMTWEEETFRRGLPGGSAAWVQENEAYNRHRGVIRGLHFQRPPFAQSKLVRVVAGAVLDVFVDLRRGSPTYGQWDAVELSAHNHRIVYIPRGFAHGYCTLTDESLVLYKVDAPYAPEHDGGIRWDDETLGITWPAREALVSVKDRNLPRFRDFVSPFTAGDVAK
jgi:dTDP-4-dehydrorhamnose 3,5-epimerase